MKNLGAVLLVLAMSLSFIFLAAINKEREMSSEPFYPIGQSFSCSDKVMFVLEIIDIPRNVEWYGSFEHIWYSYNSITKIEKITMASRYSTTRTVLIHYDKTTEQITRLSITDIINYVISRKNDAILMDNQLITDIDDIETCKYLLGFYTSVRNAIYETYKESIE